MYKSLGRMGGMIAQEGSPVRQPHLRRLEHAAAMGSNIMPHFNIHTHCPLLFQCKSPCVRNRSDSQVRRHQIELLEHADELHILKITRRLVGDGAPHDLDVVSSEMKPIQPHRRLQTAHGMQNGMA